ncbi:hypothetical protein Tco_0851238 [Tanacetum coccineum]
MESKTKTPAHRTYNMVNEKWKTMRPNGDRFCGVHANVMRRAQISGARGGDYFVKALLNYDAEYGVPFTQKNAKRYKRPGSSSFNTESGDARINLNVDVGDDNEDEVQAVERPMGMDKAKGLKKKGARVSGSSSSMNDEALARLMVSDLQCTTNVP